MSFGSLESLRVPSPLKIDFLHGVTETEYITGEPSGEDDTWAIIGAAQELYMQVPSDVVVVRRGRVRVDHLGRKPDGFHQEMHRDLALVEAWADRQAASGRNQ